MFSFYFMWPIKFKKADILLSIHLSISWMDAIQMDICSLIQGRDKKTWFDLTKEYFFWFQKQKKCLCDYCLKLKF